MVTFPAELLDEFDRRAQQENRSRSELLCEAARQYLRGNAPQPAKLAARTQAAGIIEQLRIQALQRAQQNMDSTALIRNFRKPLADERS